MAAFQVSAPGVVTLLSPDLIAGNPWVKFNRTIDPAPPDEDDPSEATPDWDEMRGIVTRAEWSER